MLRLGAEIVRFRFCSQVCQEVAEDIFENFDQNGDGSLDFQELLRSVSVRAFLAV